eukprot:TRINITY_DN9148_c0_g1_i6.p1 TRINITY_DN9148_c0_g1~~TRINITY_DN9148_c0_g1_i6.p1  ORF type:complete len:526 (+),score=198.56 TRINITY_DN9148_c0_g1_i6:1365-2942(+)
MLLTDPPPDDDDATEQDNNNQSAEDEDNFVDAINLSDTQNGESSTSGSGSGSNAMETDDVDKDGQGDDANDTVQVDDGSNNVDAMTSATGADSGMDLEDEVQPASIAKQSTPDVKADSPQSTSTPVTSSSGLKRRVTRSSSRDKGSDNSVKDSPKQQQEQPEMALVSSESSDKTDSNSKKNTPRRGSPRTLSDFSTRGQLALSNSTSSSSSSLINTPSSASSRRSKVKRSGSGRGKRTFIANLEDPMDDAMTTTTSTSSSMMMRNARNSSPPTLGGGLFNSNINVVPTRRGPSEFQLFLDQQKQQMEAMNPSVLFFGDHQQESSMGGKRKRRMDDEFDVDSQAQKVSRVGQDIRQTVDSKQQHQLRALISGISDYPCILELTNCHTLSQLKYKLLMEFGVSLQSMVLYYDEDFDDWVVLDDNSFKSLNGKVKLKIPKGEKVDKRSVSPKRFRQESYDDHRYERRHSPPHYSGYRGEREHRRPEEYRQASGSRSGYRGGRERERSNSPRESLWEDLKRSFSGSRDR